MNVSSHWDLVLINGVLLHTTEKRKGDTSFYKFMSIDRGAKGVKNLTKNISTVFFLKFGDEFKILFSKSLKTERSTSSI
ncbi:Os05g0464150 [Oryza sativa Japonica Group]|uniref:Os05g0464150 protein n=1 Tax=Oryza sativa subsp. japonica TaxID=39947 RepID=A0A0P0WNC0_ORYSJ|nr:hypothetical protein EE612_030032 [Oryza sativa]BAS94438.1 Os05g0464150 [Oryza sativa Japonica Group]